MAKTHIKVFITKTLKFRARIKEEGKPAYEVTIGGKSWKMGKGQEHHTTICDKCRVIVECLDQQRLNLVFHQL
jgi:hypothetical protein